MCSIEAATHVMALAFSSSGGGEGGGVIGLGAVVTTCDQRMLSTVVGCK